MIGDEAAPYQAMLELSKPVEEGTIKDWDDMEILWDYSFKKVHKHIYISLSTQNMINCY